MQAPASPGNPRLRRWIPLLADSAALTLASGVGGMLQLGLQILVVRLTTPVGFGAYVAAGAYARVMEMVVTSRSGELALQQVGKPVVQGSGDLAWAAARRLERQDLLLFILVYLGFVPVAAGLARVAGLELPLLLGLGLALPVQAGYGVSKSLFIATGRLRAQAGFETIFWGVHVVVGVAGVLLAGIPGLVAGGVVGALAKTLVARRMTWPWLPA